MESTKVSQDQLFAMIDMVNNKRNSLPKDQSSDLIQQLSKYKVCDLHFICFIFLYFSEVLVPSSKYYILALLKGLYVTPKFAGSIAAQAKTLC